MAELTTVDYDEFVAGEDATQNALDAVLAAARRYCGWHVSPVVTETITVDGPGGRVLSLPTRNLLDVSALSENGVAFDVDALDVSRVKGTVEKYPLGVWTSRAGAITATITHGHNEAEAADWRRAILQLVGLRLAGSTRDSGDLKRKKVDNVEYEWFETVVANDAELAARFAQFRILPST